MPSMLNKQSAIRVMWSMFNKSADSVQEPEGRRKSLFVFLLLAFFNEYPKNELTNADRC